MRARRRLPGPGGSTARITGLARRQGRHTQRPAGDAGIQDEDRAASGGQLLGGETGVVHRARQHRADVNGEDLVGTLQGGGVGGREFSDTGPRGGGGLTILDRMERHDLNAAAVRERRRQTSGGIGDDGEGHGFRVNGGGGRFCGLRGLRGLRPRASASCFCAH